MMHKEVRTIAKFWNWVKNQSDGSPELRIDGDIGESFWGWLFDLDEVSPQSFRDELSQYAGQDIVVWINSNGGDVVAASQIYTALKEHQGKVTIKVDGTAISAASVIAMAGDEILMSPTSVMMIHNPWSGANGEAKDFRHMADMLDEVKETIINAYQLKTGLTRDEISNLMDAETWMGAKKAVENGFADGMLYDDESTPDVVNGLVRGAKMVFNSLMLSKPAPQNRHSNLDGGTPSQTQNMKGDESVNELEQARQNLSVANNFLESVRNALNVSTNDQIVGALSALQANAKLGETYKTKVVDEACGSGVRALGDAFNVESMKLAFANLPVSEVEKIRDSYEAQAKTALGGGGQKTVTENLLLPDNPTVNPQVNNELTPEEKAEQARQEARNMLKRTGNEKIMKGE